MINAHPYNMTYETMTSYILVHIFPLIAGYNSEFIIFAIVHNDFT